MLDHAVNCIQALKMVPPVYGSTFDAVTMSSIGVFCTSQFVPAKSCV